MSVKIQHNAGFFSCCSVKLDCIVKFVNSNKKLPNKVDSSEQFIMYKKPSDKNTDITYKYFEHYDKINNIEALFPINFIHNHQFVDYVHLDFQHLKPIVQKYFSPSVEINDIVNNMINKYNINCDSCIAAYYRGTDKHKETRLASFDDFYKKILEVKSNDNDELQILLQSDSAQFIDYIKSKNMKNIIIIDENETSYTNGGIHNDNRAKSTDANYYQIFNFLSTIIIISRCKHLICSSGNCSLWALIYRGNSKNVYQSLNNRWFR
jgi:hypothetical protein